MSRTEHLTDLGNSERLAKQHSGRARYCRALGGWLTWDGTRWHRDEGDQAITELAKATVLSSYAEASKVTDDNERAALVKHARRSESAASIRNMIQLARSHPLLAAKAGDFDCDPMLFNCLNGTVDLRTGALRDHDPADMITNLAGCAFDPDAEAPGFTRFLTWVTCNRPELATYLQRVFGYLLTGKVNERVIFFFFGVGRNGKSVLAELLRKVMGEYAQTYPIDSLMAKRTGSSHPTDVAKLKGSRAAFSGEGEQEQALDVAKVKRLTGNEQLSARYMARDWFDFEPTHKHVVSTNYKPRVGGDDQAAWDRIHPVPFDNRIAEEDVDPALGDDLLIEAAGILVWAVRGCLDWQQSGLAAPDVVREAAIEYRASQDDVHRFLHEHTVRRPGGRVQATQLHAAYQLWAADECAWGQLEIRPFGARVVAWLGADTRYTGPTGRSTWKDVALLTPPEDCQ